MNDPDIITLNAKMPRPNLEVGQIIQTAFFEDTSKRHKYGFAKPAKIIAIRPSPRPCHSGWLMDLQWPDGFTYTDLDTGWAKEPKHITKKGVEVKPSRNRPEQFDLFNLQPE